MLTSLLFFSPEVVFWEISFTLLPAAPPVPLSLYLHTQPSHKPSHPGSVQTNVVGYVNQPGEPRPGFLHCPALDALSQRPINWRYVNKQHPTSGLLTPRRDFLPEQAETCQPCSHSKRAPSLLGALFLAPYQELCKSVAQPPGLRPYPSPHPVLGLLPMVSTSSPP